MATSQQGTGPTLFSRCVAAGGASVVSALVVNPLDVLKVRMQAEAAKAATSTSAPIRSHSTSCSVSRFPIRCSTNRLHDNSMYSNLMEHLRHGCKYTSSASSRHNAFMVESLHDARLALAGAGMECACSDVGLEATASSSTSAAVTKRSTMSSTFRRIVQQEGLPVLYRGLDSALLISFPMVSIYMPMYDYLSSHLSQLGAYAPMVAGAAARTSAIFCVAPLELVRTRQQANGSGSTWQALKNSMGLPEMYTSAERSGSAAASAASRAMQVVPRLWTGFSATLARDVPFSALYWGLLEPIRTALLADAASGASSTSISTTDAIEHSSARPSSSRLMFANALAGGAAGSLAAAATTPFDVVKTRLQISATSSSGGKRMHALDMLRHIHRSEGAASLFTGLGPRVVRCAPACAIVVTSYELLKSVLS